MTLTQAKQRVGMIEAMSADYESAHGAEDDLRADFIAYVMRVGPSELREMAAVVLSTDDLDFPRYCA